MKIAITYLSIRLSLRMKPAQLEWNAQIERRVAATSHTLQHMKSIKMSGLTNVVVAFLQNMLHAEVLTSFKLRKLLSVLYGLGM